MCLKFTLIVTGSAHLDVFLIDFLTDPLFSQKRNSIL